MVFNDLIVVEVTTKSMNSDIVEYLRQLALTFTRLSRDCPHSPTAHELEALAADLMEKAKQIEELQQ
jgi:hypothetical protein